MDDLADVGLSMPSPKRARRHHDDALALAHEPRLVLGAVLSVILPW
jgi:hypothetical protein